MGSVFSVRALRSPVKSFAEQSPLGPAPIEKPESEGAMASNKSRECDPGLKRAWPIMFHEGVKPDIVDAANVTAVAYYKMAIQGTARLKKTDGTRAKHIVDAFNAVRLPGDSDVLANKEEPVELHAMVDLLQDRVIGRFMQAYAAKSQPVPAHLIGFNALKFNSIADRLKKMEAFHGGITINFGNPLTPDEIGKLPLNPKKHKLKSKKPKTA